jgi:hypothetical protein
MRYFVEGDYFFKFCYLFFNNFLQCRLGLDPVKSVTGVIILKAQQACMQRPGCCMYSLDPTLQLGNPIGEQVTVNPLSR